MFHGLNIIVKNKDDKDFAKTSTFLSFHHKIPSKFHHVCSHWKTT